MSARVAARLDAKRPLSGWTLHDGLVVARRNLIQTVRVPELLFFSLVQPVIFVLLFAYVFGGAIPIPGDTGANAYREYLMPGIFGQTVAFAAAASTVGLAEDMHKGIIDRFRSLPMSPPAVLLGRTFADACPSGAGARRPEHHRTARRLADRQRAARRVLRLRAPAAVRLHGDLDRRVDRALHAESGDREHRRTGLAVPADVPVELRSCRSTRCPARCRWSPRGTRSRRWCSRAASCSATRPASSRTTGRSTTRSCTR